MAAGQIDILVVDDDPWIVELVVMAAEERNWTVATASNGPIALKHLEDHQFRLILLDVRMPLQDGWSVLEEIERQYPDHPPIIMMTANQVEEDSALNGAAAILRKPFGMHAFLDLLGHYLR